VLSVNNAGQQLGVLKSTTPKTGNDLVTSINARLQGDVQSVLAHYSGESPETAAMVTVGDYPTSVNADSVQRVANLMADFGMLSGPISVGFMTLP